MMDYTIRIDDILGMIATEIQITIISYHPPGEFTALALEAGPGEMGSRRTRSVYI